MSLRSSEWVAVLYFTYLAATAWLTGNSSARARVTAGSMMVIAVVLWTSQYRDGAGVRLREWLPLAYILVAYWLPGLLVSVPSRTLERSLTAFDSRWLSGAETLAG